MSYLTEPSFIIGILFSIMVPILFFIFMKSGKESGHLLLDWKTSSQWEGRLSKCQLNLGTKRIPRLEMILSTTLLLMQIFLALAKVYCKGASQA